MTERLDRLILGCGKLDPVGDRAGAVKLLEAAYASGIRRFDLAPLYGHGLAEKLVGEVFRDCRDTLDITTKAGLARPHQPTGAKALLLSVKATLKKWNGLDRLRKQVAADHLQKSHSTGNMAMEFLRASFDESLAQLGANRISTLLLHEAHGQLPDDVQSWLAGLVQQGVIQGYGCGTGGHLAECLNLGAGAVMQFRYDPKDAPAVRALAESGCRLRIHGVFRGDSAILREDQRWEGFDAVLGMPNTAIVFATGKISRLTEIRERYLSLMKRTA